MVEMNCPWCEARVQLRADATATYETCQECLTTWMYEEAADVELALAA